MGEGSPGTGARGPSVISATYHVRVVGYMKSAGIWHRGTTLADPDSDELWIVPGNVSSTK